MKGSPLSGNKDHPVRTHRGYLLRCCFLKVQAEEWQSSQRQRLQVSPYRGCWPGAGHPVLLVWGTHLAFSVWRWVGRGGTKWGSCIHLPTGLKAVGFMVQLLGWPLPSRWVRALLSYVLWPLSVCVFGLSTVSDCVKRLSKMSRQS